MVLDPDDRGTGGGRRGFARRLSTETRRSPQTSELWVYLAAVLGVLIASAVIDGGDGGRDDDYFLADEAWLLITVLTVGYLLSRGWAKSGSREPYWEDPDVDRGIVQRVTDAVTPDRSDERS